MSRYGQCPACRTGYELEQEHIGRSLDCECGATLFAADVVGFSEIPVLCDQCDGEYVVDKDGAGETVECECGAHLTVPDVVLRMPVSSRGQSAADAIETAESQDPQATDEVQLKKGERLVACPDCEKNFVVTKEDVGVEAVCECRCAFTIKVTDKKKVVAVKISKPTASSKKNRDDSKEEHEEKEDRGSKKKTSPLKWFAVAAGAFLLFSVCFAVAKKAGLLAKAKPKTEEQKVVELGPVEELDPIEVVAVDAPAEANSESTDLAASNVNIVTPSGPETATNSSDTPAKSSIQSVFAAPPKKPLPKAAAARPLVPIVATKKRGATFAKALEDVLIEYDKTKELETEAAKSNDNTAYHQQLGKTIGDLQQAMALGNQAGSRIANRKVDVSEQMESIRFMLAFSYFKAGYLAEASILGEAVARYGSKAREQTKSGAMIAMAATQEANATHWAQNDNTGELDQMRRVIQLIAKRWPKDPQLDLYYLNLAQLYDRFNEPLKAASIYRFVPESSQHYATSQLAAGSALWAEYRTVIAENPSPDPKLAKRHEKIRVQARKFLATGVSKSVTDDSKPTMEILVAKLALARIEVIGEKLDAAEKWLSEGPIAPTKSIAVKAGVEGKVNVSPGFVRLIYETLFSIRSQLDNSAGANEALTEMASILGPEHSDQLGKLFLNAATSYIGQLSQSPVISRKQFSELSKLIEPLKGQDSALTASNILWLGEAWSKLAPRAANEKLKKQCFDKAATAYELAMSRDDFKKSNLQAAQLRRSQLLRGAGQLDDAAALIGKVLKESPNAFKLQLEAAECLQQAAIESQNPLGLVDAVNGPSGSPIWGWRKVVTTLHSFHYSDSGNEESLERLLMAQYNLAKCQWLIAKATTDPAKKTERMVALHKLMKQISGQIPPDAQPWAGKFNQLVAEVNKAK